MTAVQGLGLPTGPWPVALYSPNRPVPPLTAPLPDAKDQRCGAKRHIQEGDCPDACRFLQPLDDGEVCSFRCVADCRGKKARHLSYADPERMVCTRCPIPGCMLCSSKDTCEKCFVPWAYKFIRGGTSCVLRIRHVGWVFVTVLVTPVLVLGAWYASLHCRSVANEDVRARAVIHMDRQKLRDHGRHSHNWYPLTVSLLMPDLRGHAIGGLGLALHFRFQLAALAWTALAALMWLALLFFSPASTATGYHQFWNEEAYLWCNTSHTAIASEKSEQLQSEILMLAYVTLLYVSTTVGALIFAFYQHSFFNRWAANVTSMQDYALFLEGFPEEAGESVEGEREAFVREACDCTLVGLSVCWGFSDCAQEVDEAIRQETWYRQRSQSRDSIQTADLRHVMRSRTSWPRDNVRLSRGTHLRGQWRKLANLAVQKFAMLDPLFLPGSYEEGSSFEFAESVKGLLDSISSTGHACAVFETVQDRDRAREKFEQGGPKTLFKGRHRVRASGLEKDTEPDNVLWSSLGSANLQRRRTVVFSILRIILAIGLWAGFLYVPWGYYVALHMETFGQLPDMLAESIFTMLVVCGNQLIYLLCLRASRSVACYHTGQQEALYSVLYSIAILVNMGVDIYVLRWTSVKALNQLDMSIPGGSLRGMMSDRLWKYNFPSCFLIPFMVEPLFLYVLPVDLANRLIGTREDMDQAEADELMQPAPMDLSRYQDILLNLTQAVCALFLQPTYVLRTWLGLLLGQVFIFAWDHFKVLRVVRAFTFSSCLSERVAQRLTALPCGFLGACVAQRYFVYRKMRDAMGEAEHLKAGQVAASSMLIEHGAVLALVLMTHVTLHILFLHHMMPPKTVSTSEERWERKAKSYQEMALERPANYFNTNPVHCLRSRHLHKHYPACGFYITGKEHLLEANPCIGQYYQARRWDDKRKTFTMEMSVVTRSFRRSILKVPSIPERYPAGGAILSGRLWKLCRPVAEPFMADFRQKVNFPLVPAGSAAEGRRATLRASLSCRASPWHSLESWRLRFFRLSETEEGLFELAYSSEKSEQQEVACRLPRQDTSMQVQLLPRLQMDPLDAPTERLLRLQLASYKVAFEPEQREAGIAGPAEDLPTELHPLAITWTDELGDEHLLIVAHERVEHCEEWFQQLVRSNGGQAES